MLPNHYKDVIKDRPLAELAPDTYSYLYTDIDSALTQLHNRQSNVALAEKVHSELGPTASEILNYLKTPSAVLFRQVATPTHEFIQFLEVAKYMHLQPLFFEYYSDMFVGAGNPYKRTLGKMPVFQYRGSDARDMYAFKTILDFNHSTGKPLSELRTTSGESLVGFHHRLLRSVAPSSVDATYFDASKWFQAEGKSAAKYHHHFLTLFIRDAILLENYFPTEEESQFTRDVVVPAFDQIVREYGMKPLIVRLLPRENETDRFWESYPKSVEQYL